MNYKGWWRKIVSLVEGEKGVWFRAKLKKTLGDGKSEGFWEGSWSGEVRMKDRFPRLYHLSVNKTGSVADLGKWEECIWTWNLGWRRRILEREVPMVNELLTQLRSILLIEGREDGWKWGNRNDGHFTVKEAYEDILKIGFEQRINEQGGSEFKFIWKVAAPFKAQVTAWRLFWNRLPTADKLRRADGMSEEERKCCCCKVEDETASHFFLRCAKAEWMWKRMADWIGIHWTSPRTIKGHFISFCYLLKGGVTKKKLGDLWTCVIWVLWNWRNKVIFDKKEWDLKKIEDEIKCRFWS